MFKVLFLIFTLLYFPRGVFASGDLSNSWIKINGREYEPFLRSFGERKSEYINSFEIQKYPVSKKEFLDFINKHQNFTKKNVSSLFADVNYLNDIDFGINFDEPITKISWFIATKYCNSINAVLPTISQWEVASLSETKEEKEKLITWYSTPSNGKINGRKNMSMNKNKVYGMIGTVWEWVLDYNSIMIAVDSRDEATEKVKGLFCGGGSLNAKDASNYPAFMRFAFRSGLTGKYTNESLGFRCVRNKK